jgi:hypothetical protein
MVCSLCEKPGHYRTTCKEKKNEIVAMPEQKPISFKEILLTTPPSPPSPPSPVYTPPAHRFNIQVEPFSLDRFISNIFTKLSPTDWRTNSAWSLIRFMYASNPDAFQVIKATDDPMGVHSDESGMMYISVAVNAPGTMVLTLHIFVSKSFSRYKALRVSAKIKNTENAHYTLNTVADFTRWHGDAEK